jgi:hypothetical protein
LCQNVIEKNGDRPNRTAPGTTRAKRIHHFADWKFCSMIGGCRLPALTLFYYQETFSPGASSRRTARRGEQPQTPAHAVPPAREEIVEIPAARQPPAQPQLMAKKNSQNFPPLLPNPLATTRTTVILAGTDHF